MHSSTISLPRVKMERIAGLLLPVRAFAAKLEDFRTCIRLRQQVPSVRFDSESHALKLASDTFATGDYATAKLMYGDLFAHSAESKCAEPISSSEDPAISRMPKIGVLRIGDTAVAGAVSKHWQSAQECLDLSDIRNAVLHLEQAVGLAVCTSQTAAYRVPLTRVGSVRVRRYVWPKSCTHSWRHPAAAPRPRELLMPRSITAHHADHWAARLLPMLGGLHVWNLVRRVYPTWCWPRMGMCFTQLRSLLEHLQKLDSLDLLARCFFSADSGTIQASGNGSGAS